MGSEASVSPKERVNIVYRPASAQGNEEVELPLKMLVIGNFSGRGSAVPVEKRGAVGVNKETLDEVLKSQEITLQISVRNRLVEEPEGEVAVELPISSMKDFEPDAVAAHIPELKRLLELREALRALKGPLGNVPEFRRKLQELLAEGEGREKLKAEIAWRGKGEDQ